MVLASSVFRCVIALLSVAATWAQLSPRCGQDRSCGSGAEVAEVESMTSLLQTRPSAPASVSNEGTTMKAIPVPRLAPQPTARREGKTAAVTFEGGSFLALSEYAALNSTQADCSGDYRSYNAGRGLCDTYAAGGSNHDYCDQDKDSSGDLAQDVCHECGICGEIIIEDVPEMPDSDIAEVMDWIKAEVTMVKIPFCWKDTYQRGGGHVPGRVADCPSSYTNNGATCGRGAHDYSAPSHVASCPSGYTNHGLTCHRAASSYTKGCTTVFKKFHCGSGYTDMGCHCWRGPHNVGTGSMVCSSGYFVSLATGRCHRDCDSGYTNMGETCHRPVSTLGMSSMSCNGNEERHGARCYPKGGGLQGCWGHEENDAGLCYPKCSTGYSGVASVCSTSCGNSQAKCGIVELGYCRALTVSDCDNSEKVIAPLVVAANIASFGLSAPATAGAQTIQVGGKTVAGTSKAGKALVKVVTTLQSVNPTGLKKGATVTRRIVHARTGTQLKKVTTTAKVGLTAYKAGNIYRKVYADEFATLTSAAIEAELNSHFTPTTANFLKGLWGEIQLEEMAEANGWQIAGTVLAAVSIVDITGVTGLVAAYAKPICKAVVHFPCIAAALNCR